MYNFFKTPGVYHIKTLRSKQNGRHLPNNIFKCIFLNGNVWILTKISLRFVSMGPINNIPALVQIMSWRRPGDKPLSEPMLVRLLTHTVYPKKYAHGFCFAVLCCGYTLTDFPISIRLTSLALWQSNDCPSASKATLMNMDKYFMWIHYERLHNHNKAKHNKTVCIFLGIYCICVIRPQCVSTEISWTSIGIRTGISNYLQAKQWDIITHPWPNFKGCCS